MKPKSTAIRQRTKQAIKSVPGFRSAQNFAPLRHSQILEQLALFAPNSAGRPAQRTSLALQSAYATLPTLAAYISEFSPVTPSECDSANFDLGSPVDASELERLFNKFSSDKSDSHDYHLVYAKILADMDIVSAILEVGLGTNNEDVVSNMSREGTPGASLRAFREYLPNAEIYGADIDKRVLFREERITTYFVDQTDAKTVQVLGQQLPELDLVIDDGLHSPDANMNIVALARTKLRDGGWIVVEDIGSAALPFWRVVTTLLKDDFDATIVNAKNGHLWVARRRR